MNRNSLYSYIRSPQKRQKLRLKAISTILSTALLYQSAAVPLAQASVISPQALPASDSAISSNSSSVSSSITPRLGLASFSLPTTLGEIVSADAPAETARVVYHIQDVHNHLAAQTNLSEIIGRLDQFAAKQNKKLLVAVEGAAGLYDPSQDSAYPDRQKRDQVADGLLRSGFFFGENHAAVKSEPGRVLLVGVETPSLYNDNVYAKKDSAQARERVLEKIQDLKDQLGKLKRHNFSRLLRNLEAHRVGFEEGRISLDQYVKFMASVDARAVSLSPELSRVSRLGRMEGEADFAALEQDTQKLLALLVKKGGAEKTQSLFEEAQALKSGQISPLYYYRKLVQNAGETTPAIQSYLAYLDEAGKTNPEKLFDELFTVEMSLARSLVRHPLAAELYEHVRWIERQEKLYSLSLIPQEWVREKKERLQEVYARYGRIQDFVSEQTGNLGYSFTAPSFSLSQLKTAFDGASRFYRAAENRDGAMVSNLAKALKKHGQNEYLAVFIAGGFHTEGVTRELKKEGLAYVVIRPNIETGIELSKEYHFPQPERLIQIVNQLPEANNLRPVNAPMAFPGAFQKIAANAHPASLGQTDSLKSTKDSESKPTSVKKQISDSLDPNSGHINANPMILFLAAIVRVTVFSAWYVGRLIWTQLRLAKKDKEFEKDPEHKNLSAAATPRELLSRRGSNETPLGSLRKVFTRKFKDFISGSALSPDKKILVVADLDGGFRLVDTATGKQLGSRRQVHNGEAYGSPKIVSIFFAESGAKLVLTTEFHNSFVWDVTRPSSAKFEGYWLGEDPVGETPASAETPKVVGVSPNGDLILQVGIARDNAISLIRSDDYSVYPTGLRTGHFRNLQSAFNPDGTRLAVKSDQAMDVTVLPLNRETGLPQKSWKVQVSREHDDYFFGRLSGDREVLFGLDDNGVLTAYNPEPGVEEPRLFTLDLGAYDDTGLFSVDPSGKNLVLPDHNSVVFIPLGSLGDPFSIQEWNPAGGEVWDVTFTPDGKTMITEGRTEISLYEISQPRQKRRNLSAAATPEELLSDRGPVGGPLMIFMAALRWLDEWSRRLQKSPVQRVFAKRVKHQVSKTALSPDGKLFVLGTANGELIFLNPENGRQYGQIKSALGERANQSLDFARIEFLYFVNQGKNLLVQNGARRIFVWDVADPASPRPLGRAWEIESLMKDEALYASADPRDIGGAPLMALINTTESTKFVTWDGTKGIKNLGEVVLPGGFVNFRTIFNQAMTRMVIVSKEGDFFVFSPQRDGWDDLSGEKFSGAFPNDLLGFSFIDGEGQFFGALGEEGTLSVWSLDKWKKNGAPYLSVQLQDDFAIDQDHISAAAFHPTKRIVAYSRKGSQKVVLFDWGFPSERSSYREINLGESEAEEIQFSPEGEALYVSATTSQSLNDRILKFNLTESKPQRSAAGGPLMIFMAFFHFLTKPDRSKNSKEKIERLFRKLKKEGDNKLLDKNDFQFEIYGGAAISFNSLGGGDFDDDYYGRIDWRDMEGEISNAPFTKIVLDEDNNLLMGKNEDGQFFLLDIETRMAPRYIPSDEWPTGSIRSSFDPSWKKFSKKQLAPLLKGLRKEKKPEFLFYGPWNFRYEIFDGAIKFENSHDEDEFPRGQLDWRDTNGEALNSPIVSIQGSKEDWILLARNSANQVLLFDLRSPGAPRYVPFGEWPKTKYISEEPQSLTDKASGKYSGGPLMLSLVLMAFYHWTAQWIKKRAAGKVAKKYEIEHEEGAESWAISSDGRILVVGSAYGKLRFLDAENGETYSRWIDAFRTGDLSHNIESLFFLDKDRLLVVQSSEGNIALWNVKDPVNPEVIGFLRGTRGGPDPRFRYESDFIVGRLIAKHPQTNSFIKAYDRQVLQEGSIDQKKGFVRKGFLKISGEDGNELAVYDSIGSRLAIYSPSDNHIYVFDRLLNSKALQDENPIKLKDGIRWGHSQETQAPPKFMAFTGLPSYGPVLLEVDKKDIFRVWDLDGKEGEEPIYETKLRGVGKINDVALVGGRVAVTEKGKSRIIVFQLHDIKNDGAWRILNSGLPEGGKIGVDEKQDAIFIFGEKAFVRLELTDKEADPDNDFTFEQASARAKAWFLETVPSLKEFDLESVKVREISNQKFVVDIAVWGVLVTLYFRTGITVPDKVEIDNKGKKTTKNTYLAPGTLKTLFKNKARSKRKASSIKDLTNPNSGRINSFPGFEILWVAVGVVLTQAVKAVNAFRSRRKPATQITREIIEKKARAWADKKLSGFLGKDWTGGLISLQQTLVGWHLIRFRSATRQNQEITVIYREKDNQFFFLNKKDLGLDGESYDEFVVLPEQDSIAVKVSNYKDSRWILMPLISRLNQPGVANLPLSRSPRQIGDWSFYDLAKETDDFTPFLPSNTSSFSYPVTYLKSDDPGFASFTRRAKEAVLAFLFNQNPRPKLKSIENVEVIPSKGWAIVRADINGFFKVFIYTEKSPDHYGVVDYTNAIADGNPVGKDKVEILDLFPYGRDQIAVFTSEPGWRKDARLPSNYVIDGPNVEKPSRQIYPLAKDPRETKKSLAIPPLLAAAAPSPGFTAGEPLVLMVFEFASFMLIVGAGFFVAHVIRAFSETLHQKIIKNRKETSPRKGASEIEGFVYGGIFGAFLVTALVFALAPDLLELMRFGFAFSAGFLVFRLVTWKGDSVGAEKKKSDGDESFDHQKKNLSPLWLLAPLGADRVSLLANESASQGFWLAVAVVFALIFLGTSVYALVQWQKEKQKNDKLRSDLFIVLEENLMDWIEKRLPNYNSSKIRFLDVSPSSFARVDFEVVFDGDQRGVFEFDQSKPLTLRVYPSGSSDENAHTFVGETEMTKKLADLLSFPSQENQIPSLGEDSSQKPGANDDYQRLSPVENGEVKGAGSQAPLPNERNEKPVLSLAQIWQEKEISEEDFRDFIQGPLTKFNQSFDGGKFTIFVNEEGLLAFEGKRFKLVGEGEKDKFTGFSAWWSKRLVAARTESGLIRLYDIGEFGSPLEIGVPSEFLPAGEEKPNRRKLEGINFSVEYELAKEVLSVIETSAKLSGELVIVPMGWATPELDTVLMTVHKYKGDDFEEATLLVNLSKASFEVVNPGSEKNFDEWKPVEFSETNELGRRIKKVLVDNAGEDYHLREKIRAESGWNSFWVSLVTESGVAEEAIVTFTAPRVEIVAKNSEDLGRFWKESQYFQTEETESPLSDRDLREWFEDLSNEMKEELQSLVVTSHESNDGIHFFDATVDGHPVTVSWDEDKDSPDTATIVETGFVYDFDFEGPGVKPFVDGLDELLRGEAEPFEDFVAQFDPDSSDPSDVFLSEEMKGSPIERPLSLIKGEEVLSGQVTNLVASRDGKFFATSSPDGRIEVYDAATLSKQGSFSVLSGELLAEPGAMVLSEDGKTVYYLDASKSGKELISFKFSKEEVPHPAYLGVEYKYLARSGDGKTLLAYGRRDATVIGVNGDNLEVHEGFFAHGVVAAALSHHGELVAMALENGELFLSEVSADGKIYEMGMPRILLPDLSPIHYLSFTPDGKGLWAVRKNGTLLFVTVDEEVHSDFPEVEVFDFASNFPKARVLSVAQGPHGEALIFLGTQSGSKLISVDPGLPQSQVLTLLLPRVKSGLNSPQGVVLTGENKLLVYQGHGSKSEVVVYEFDLKKESESKEESKFEFSLSEDLRRMKELRKNSEVEKSEALYLVGGQIPTMRTQVLEEKGLIAKGKGGAQTIVNPGRYGVEPEESLPKGFMPDQDDPDNFVHSALLHEEDDEAFLGSRPLSGMEEVSADTPLNVFLKIISMDGGVGANFTRLKYILTYVVEALKKIGRWTADAAARVLGAKGTDLLVPVTLTDQQGQYVHVEIPVAEAKLNQLILMQADFDRQTRSFSPKGKDFERLSFIPYVNKESKASYEQLLKEHYIYDLIDGAENPRTYREVLESVGIELPGMKEQHSLPWVDSETLQVPTTVIEEESSNGGHAQLGYSFLFESLDEARERRKKGLTNDIPNVGFFANGDNLNSRPSKKIVNDLIKKRDRNRGVIYQLTTAASPFDVKGGKIGLRYEKDEDGNLVGVPSIMEFGEVKNIPEQAERFREAGLEGGFGRPGTQKFNTNVHYFNLDLLGDILLRLAERLQEDLGLTEEEVEIKLAELFAPVRVPKDENGKLVPDGAIASVLLNLNRYFITTKIGKEILEEFELDRLIHFVDVDDFFTPDKFPPDHLFQFHSADSEIRDFVFQGSRSKVKYDFIQKAGAKGGWDKLAGDWADLQDLINSLDKISLAQAESVAFLGNRVKARGLEIKGEFILHSEFEGEFDFNSGSVFFTEESVDGLYAGRFSEVNGIQTPSFTFENAYVHVDKSGRVTVLPIELGQPVYEHFITPAKSGLSVSSLIGLSAFFVTTGAVLFGLDAASGFVSLIVALAGFLPLVQAGLSQWVIKSNGGSGLNDLDKMKDYKGVNVELVEEVSAFLSSVKTSRKITSVKTISGLYADADQNGRVTLGAAFFTGDGFVRKGLNRVLISLAIAHELGHFRPGQATYKPTDSAFVTLSKQVWNEIAAWAWFFLFNFWRTLPLFLGLQTAQEEAVEESWDSTPVPTIASYEENVYTDFWNQAASSLKEETGNAVPGQTFAVLDLDGLYDGDRFASVDEFITRLNASFEVDEALHRRVSTERESVLALGSSNPELLRAVESLLKKKTSESLGYQVIAVDLSNLSSVEDVFSDGRFGTVSYPDTVFIGSSERVLRAGATQRAFNLAHASLIRYATTHFSEAEAVIQNLMDLFEDLADISLDSLTDELEAQVIAAIQA